MREANARLGLVDVLPSCPARAEGVFANVDVADLHVELVGLGEHGHSRRRGVHSALAFGGGHALNAVHAAFKLEHPVDLLAADLNAGFFDAAHRALGEAQHFGGPPFFFGKAEVGAQEFSRKESGLISPRARAHFEHRIFGVFRVFGDQEFLDFGFERGNALAGGIELFLRHFAHLGVFFDVEKLLGLVAVGDGLQVAGTGLDQFVELLVFAVQAYESRGVRRQFRRHQLVVHVLVAHPNGLKFLYEVHARR